MKLIYKQKEKNRIIFYIFLEEPHQYGNVNFDKTINRLVKQQE